jgi:hypothetical protein
MRSCVTAIILSACLLAASRANAGFLYNWTTDPAGTKQVVIDPTGDNTGSASHDILDLMYAHDAVNQYFRMDLRGAPSLNDGAGTYSIQIDDKPGGGVNSDSHYIAVGLTGIDQLVMSHYSAGMGQYEAHHRHNILAPTPGVDEVDLFAIGGAVDHTENGGTTLQWSIPISQLNPGPFKIYGSVHDIDANITYDTTGGINAPTVPEPSMLLLLSILGLISTAVWRRVKAAK